MTDQFDIDLGAIVDGHAGWEAVLAPITQILGVQLNWSWLLLAIVLTAFWVTWAARVARDSTGRAQGTLSVYRSASARVDYACFLLFPMLLVGLLGLLPSGIAFYFDPWVVGESVNSQLAVTLSAVPPLLDLSVPADRGGVSVLVTVIFFSGLVLVGDFSQWAVHVASHRSAWLWRFHAFHHSAEVLTPFTGAREHLVVQVIDRLAYATTVGAYVGLAEFLAPGVSARLMLVEGGIVVFTAYWAAFLTSHYHVPVTFGPVGAILVSPGFHARHHIECTESGRQGSNFGHIFAFWDRVFGTFAPPVTVEHSPEYGPTGASRRGGGTVTRMLRWCLAPGRALSREWGSHGDS